MHRKIIITEDGSNTISIADKNITYHSKHGAIQESTHVFINAGLNYFITNNPSQQNIQIFEMGFGTGLNALLTLREAAYQNKKIIYTAIELTPITASEAAILNYGKMISMEADFLKLHEALWDENQIINENFFLHKIKDSLMNYAANQLFNIIYFDAFAPDDQPELWTETIIKKLYDMLLPNGILVTYCSKGDVKRTMKKLGFTVKRLQGPPGKWHMVRATKPVT